MTTRRMPLAITMLLCGAQPASSAPVVPPPADSEVDQSADPEVNESADPEVAAPAVTAQDVMRASHCERQLVICYDRHGELLGDDEPASLRPGNVVTVVVITDRTADKQAITVGFAEQKSLDRPFPDPAPAAFVKGLGGHRPDHFALTFPSEPIADDTSELTIRFARAPDPPRTQVLQVDLGYSYYSVAFLVAATFDGNRRVLRDLSTVTDHAVDPGLALNVFPFGRQRGVLGYLRKCAVLRPGRCAANMIGLQLATDLDLTSPTEKIYGGVVFEPIAGLAVTGGVSLRKVEVVPAPGALPALDAMDRPFPSDRRYVARGYVGITITLDLLDTIAKAGSEIKKLSSQ
jgi:hypothetical protein